jgi:hypothetical protein
VVESGNLSAGNHSLRRLCDLPCTSAAKCDWNLESATNFKQGDNVVYRNAFDEPKSGRRNVNRPLSVVKRIGLIGADRSQLAGKLGGVFAAGKLMQNPCPIVLGMGVVRGTLSRCDWMGRKEAIGG